MNVFIFLINSKLAPKDVQVYSGATSIICCGRFTNVDEIITHPNYNKRTHNNDFSLLKLEQPLHFNERTKAIQMVNEEFDVPIGKLGVVSGWGNCTLCSNYFTQFKCEGFSYLIGLTQNPKESEKELRAVFVPVISAEQCRAAYDPITPQMICAGYRAGGKDSCKGDSGGPLTMTFDNETLLVGVVSFGDGCARPDFPGVYSNVATARQWIRNVTGV